MGSKLSRSVATYRARNDRRILLLGLDGAGKSAIVAFARRASGSPSSTTLRDVAAHFDVQVMTVGKLRFHLWDVAGAEAMRPYWRHHFLGTQGVVFVFDATARSTLPTAAAELRAAAADPQLAEAAFLVLANKSDRAGALSAADLARLLDLPAMLAGHPWHAQACSAVGGKGEGLEEGWAFLAANMKEL